MTDHTTNETSVKLCECGCGQPAPIAKKSDTRHGYIIGKPVRFIKGHGARLKHDSAEARFWSRVNIGQPNDCWEWQGHLNGGYGSLRVNHEITSAHRFSYELHYGPIEHGLHCLHRCDNPVCVNPAHLFLGTNQDNVDDKIAKGRAVFPKPKRGETNSFARLTSDQVVIIRNLHQQGMTNQAISKLYDVTEGAIQAITSRRNWKHIP